MNGDLRLDAVMKSIDVFGRLAFGGQCVAAMAMIAAPLLLVTAAVLPFYRWDESRGEAIALWLVGWVVAVAVAAGGVAFAVFCWRWSGDWITEWPGYAVGISIAGVGDGALGYLLTSTGLNIYLSFALAVTSVFAAGILVAGNLAGTHVLPDQRRQRALARRR
ncbi:MAG: hypothetical protein WEC75_05385 [Dehalococcoidia bacterium]